MATQTRPSKECQIVTRTELQVFYPDDREHAVESKMQMLRVYRLDHEKLAIQIRGPRGRKQAYLAHINLGMSGITTLRDYLTQMLETEFPK